MPEVLFGDYGTGIDEIPDPAEWQVAIIPNDDREMDEDLVMYDPESDEPSSVEAWCDDRAGDVDVSEPAEDTRSESDNSEAADTLSEPEEDEPVQQPPPDKPPEEAAREADVVDVRDDRDSREPDEVAEESDYLKKY